MRKAGFAPALYSPKSHCPFTCEGWKRERLLLLGYFPCRGQVFVESVPAPAHPAHCVTLAENTVNIIIANSHHNCKSHKGKRPNVVALGRFLKASTCTESKDMIQDCRAECQEVFLFANSRLYSSAMISACSLIVAVVQYSGSIVAVLNSTSSSSRWHKKYML